MVCIRYLAFGLQWEPGSNLMGAWPYLCPYDEDQLAFELSQRIDSGFPPTKEYVALRFQQLASTRNHLAIRALTYM